MFTIDKRKHFRKSLQASASIADVLGNTWSLVNFLDISRSGVAFICLEELSIGSSRILRFQLPGDSRQISVICKVVHSAPHAYLRGNRIGAEFVRIEAQDVEKIMLFINETSDTPA